ncbi:mRNA decay activator protein ZFP36L2 [Ochotona princeps]|uniref:mRNA decay activator protein ZFP36L2 n=1 Tax=Ochotona princeps TaxID=9978 RepID=UPI002714EACA|nr:mRNA decay activator protein ZFP36L2 [Ochotona princeps]
MSTTLLSAFYDIDFLCKTEKSLANLNLNNMLDKKAVGTPVAAAAPAPSSGFAPGFLRRHSASNLHALAHPAPSPGSCSPKFPGAANGSSCGSAAAGGGPASYGGLKEPSGGGGGAGTALLNKENKFRDRSFSENGERSQHLLHLQQQQQQQKGGGGSQINSTRYKTELCRPFEESGTCKYGEKCQFAHGFHELRSLTRHPKYKTELCRTFHTIGFCPYGPRCHFIHNADERRPAPSGGGASGDLRAFSARDALHLGFPREPRPKLHHSLSFSGFPSGHHQPPGGLEAPLLLDSPTSRTPPPPSCSSASSCSSSSASASSSSCSSASTPSGAPTCCASAAAAAAAAAALLYGTGGAEDLLASGGGPCAACSAASCANNAFAFGPELSSLITPLAIQTHNFAAVAAAAYYRSQQQQQQQGLAQPPAPPSAPLPAAPPSPPFAFQLPRRLSESPVFDAPPSPPDSLSDRDSYLSGSLSSGSLSGSESPSLDPGRRLPIFSRLSISDD